MPVTKGRTLDYLEQEWGSYVERFQRLPKAEQEERIRKTGFESFQDLLAHILAWWEEGMVIIRAVAEGHQPERKKYDFDAFNAEAISHYKSWEETEFLNHFENTRHRMTSDLRNMNETLFEHRRVRSWLNGILILHAREHRVTLSRFLTLDTLENEWSAYVENFNRLDTEKQKEFLSKQGVDSFRDMLGHIIGWWEEGARIIMGILDSPAFTWTDPDVNLFNAMLKKKFASWSEEDLLQHFESVRRALIEMVVKLPADAFLNKDIESWLAAEVIEHYDAHPISA